MPHASASSFVRAGAASIVLWAVIVLAGCDTQFQPLKPSGDRVFSLYGVLDPAADTQWIRVEPLPEPTSEGAPAEIDATVQLENVDTGQIWPFHDSLMVVQTEPQHNFWTTAPIQPNTTYRVEARTADSLATWAETTTPEEAPSLLWTGDDTTVTSVLIQDVEKLAGLKVRYFSTLGFVYDVNYYSATFKTNAGYTTHFQPARDIDRLGIIGTDSAHVIAAAGGPDWPTWEEYHRASIHDLTLPDSFSNVHGGHGMVSGVYRTEVLAPF